MPIAHRLSLALLAFALSCPPASAQGSGDILNGSQLRLDPANEVDNDDYTGFGQAVALDDDVLVIGAPEEDVVAPTGVSAGAVYVFERVGDTWLQTQRIVETSDNRDDYALFGGAVDVARGWSNDYIVIGAPRDDVHASTEVGRAYIYKRSYGERGAGGFVFDRELMPSAPAGGDNFGESVAIDFDVPPDSQTDDPGFQVAVGAPDASGQSGTLTIYQRTGGPPTWNLTDEFTGSNPVGNFGTNVQMGSSVDVDGHLFVTGAPNLWMSGAQRSIGIGFLGSQGNQLPSGAINWNCCDVRLQASEASMAAGGEFQNMGRSAAVDAATTTAVLGAPRFDSMRGAVYVFDVQSGGSGDFRNEVQLLTASDGEAADQFGESLDLDGRLLVVGAPRADNDDGVVYVFEYAESRGVEQWIERGRIERPGNIAANACTFGGKADLLQPGNAVALDEATAVAGCPDNFNVTVHTAFVLETPPIFVDDFELGTLGIWSNQVP